MKTRRIIAIILTVVIAVMMVGCNNSNTICDSGITNELKYRDYKFWRQANEIRLSESIFIKEDGDTTESVKGFQWNEDSKLVEDIKLTDKQVIRIQELQEGITTFLLENFQVDVSGILAEQKIQIFEASGIWTYALMGYVSPENTQIINLNKVLLSASSNFFESTYIHETLHQLGIRSIAPCQLDEGFADALTDMICCSMGIEPVLSEDYWVCRTAAYQMLAADPGIVSCYIKGNFNILDRINDKLCDVPQPYVYEDNISKMLEDLLKISNGILTGQLVLSIEQIHEIGYLTQDIVRAYCQTCEPDKDTITYIRKHYLLEDYESITIFNVEGDYCIR